MTRPRHEIWQIADQIQMDLRAAQAKLIELRSMLASLDLPDTTRTECPTCQLKLAGPRSLAEHVHVSHDGPVPDHWLEIEARSAEPAAGSDSEKTGADDPDLDGTWS